MSTRWDWLATALLVTCAATTTALVVRHEFVKSQHDVAPSSPVPSKPIFHKNWRELLRNGVRMGPSDARVQVIEFADFECPFCQKMHSTLIQLRQLFPSDVAVTFIHYPLPQHRFAELSARAAECAARQGQFETMHNALFDNQQALGIKPWAEIANEAGIHSNADFEDCMKDSSPIQRVVDGKRLANELNVLGTPTLIVNGWQLNVPPTLEKLESMIKLIAAGREPVTD